MKKYFLSTFILCFLMLSHVYAVEEYGIVDVRQVNQEAKVYKDLQAQIQQKQTSFQAQVKSTEEALRAEEQALLQSQASLSPQEFEKRRKSLITKGETEARKVQTDRQTIEDSITVAAQDISKKLEQAVSEVSAQRKYSLVFFRSALAYSDPSRDITQDVIKALDKKVTKANLK